MPTPTYPQIQSLLRAFQKTSNPFKIIHSIHSPLISQPQSQSPSPSTLLILDSSFNPPTKAHAYLVHQAVTRLQRTQTAPAPAPHAAQFHGHSNANPARILLVLSTKNVDKASAPAALEHRLLMMVLFAQGLWDSLSSGLPSGTQSGTQHDDQARISGIDIALSTEPRFLEKSVFLAAASAAESNPYAAAGELVGAGAGKRVVVGAAQWHLLGFDTLVRLLDGKYYPPRGSLDVLAPLFGEEGNRVLVVRRQMGGESADAGDRGQEAFVRALGVGTDEGGFQAVGWNVDWAEKVELVDAFDGVRDEHGAVLGVSSTAVRSAAKQGDTRLVSEMCGQDVGEYVANESLYV